MTAWLRAPLTRLSLAAGLMLVVALSAISWLAIEAGESALQGEVAAKAQAQGETVRRKIERAFSYGIPVDRLAGLDALYAGLVANDPHLSFLAVTAENDRLLHSAGNATALAEARAGTTDRYLLTRLPLSTRGALIIGHDRAAVLAPLTESRLDVATVLVVSLALSFELLLLVLTVNVILPARIAERVLADVGQRRYRLLHGQVMRDEMGRFASRLNAAISRAAERLGGVPEPLRMPRLIGVRLLAFLFVFAEELARPIMPTFFADIAAAGAGLGSPTGAEAASADGHVAAGLAMAAHMLVIAVAMPVGSALYQHIGRLPLYVGGALLATAGMAGTALLADGLGSLMAWRALSGLGYAATFVACQGFVLESTGDHNRVQGSAMMVGGIMLADICGPAIGGIIAGHMGAHATFLLGAAVALVAAAAAGLLIDRPLPGGEAPPRITLRTFPAVLANGRLMALLLLAAVPAKLILTAFLFFLVPVALHDAGVDVSDTGRVIMLYGVGALIAGPIFARLTDRFGKPLGAVIIGGLMTAAGLLPMGWAPGMGAVMFGVIALGLAHSLSIPAQLAAALSVSQEAVAVYGKGPVIAVLRVIERLGAAAGPLVGASLATALGAEGAIWMLGTYAGVSACLLLLVQGRIPQARPT